MRAHLQRLTSYLVLMAACTLVVLPAVAAAATTCAPAACTGACIDPGTTNIPQVCVGNGLQDIVNTLSFVAGILSVIFLILGGIRYATSEGSSDKVNRAKQTMTFAVLGLIVSILAVAIVGFVISRGPQ